MIIDLGHGKANLSHTLATWGSMKVEAPFKRISAVTSGKRHGQQQVHSVGRHDMTGALINSKVEHDNGAVILVQASWKRGGSPIREGAMFFRLRVGAPHYRVDAKVPTGPENIHGDRFMVFQGYADIMNEHELTVMGITAGSQFRDRYMQTEELEECFEIRQLAGATQAKPTLTAIATPEGVKMTVMQPEPSRRLKFRRREA